ncbi:MAG: PD-(D/E)XK nuclease-like domain-containing protein [Bacteroidaceae bacterium]|nr:PD-(D/E)XK nuclease-like domain-containing protein [Bacteroidaceae bacterium]
MVLNESTYYNEEASREFMSVSQFKNFQKCEAAAMAELKGEYVPERGRALFLGSYVDEMLTGTKESQYKFVDENRAELFQKNGKAYADIAQATAAIKRIREQPLMMKYLGGEHQVVMTGEIEGVPFKIKMDSYKPGEFIADLKYMASLRSPNLFQPMISYWGYDIQAACYQEIVRQNTGKQLPFLFVVATKEKPAHLAVGEINQWNMDAALETVRKNIKRYQAIKNGEIEPERCEDYGCDYCTTTKIITEPIDTDLFGMSRAQIRISKGEV